MTDNLKGLPVAKEAARDIRVAVLAGTSPVASAGLPYDKSLVGTASGHREPDAPFAITPVMGAAPSMRSP